MQGILVFLYDIQYARSCCCLLPCGRNPPPPPPKWSKTKPRRGASILTDKRCARSSSGMAATYSLPSFLLQGLLIGLLLAVIGLRQYPIKSEFRTMHPKRTRIRQLSTGQYHRRSHVDLGLPLMIITAGFAASSNPNPTRHPGAGSPGRCEWTPYCMVSIAPRQKEVRVSSDKLKQDKIIEGADISTYTTDDAVSFRLQPTDARSRRLVPDDQSEPASEGLVRKRWDRLAQRCWLVS